MIRKFNGVDLSPPSTAATNNFTSINVTGTLSETILSTVLIPADTFKRYDIVGFESRLRKGGIGLSPATIRVRIGTTKSLTATTVATYSSTTGTHSYIPIMRRMVIKIASGILSGTEIFNSTTSLASDTQRGGTEGVSNININWTIDNYIIVTGQLSNTADTMNCMYLVTDYITGL